jgi:hypothetical protein
MTASQRKASGMPRRRGQVCVVCGYPAPESTAPLCDQCHDWQGVAAYADAAIQFSKSPALAPGQTKGGEQ